MRVQRVCRCGRGCDGSAPSVKDMLHGRGKRRGERRRACLDLVLSRKGTAGSGQAHVTTRSVDYSPKILALSYLCWCVLSSAWPSPSRPAQHPLRWQAP
eukprot:scaffold6060_cov54-Phaeocystis_antarctica.AAC.1